MSPYHRNINAIGIIFNAILLFLIRRFSKIELGTYKYLLATFAVIDIFCQYYIGQRIRKYNESIQHLAMLRILELKHLMAFYFACFSAPFALLNIHFLYRYWTINQPTLISHFSNPKFIALLSLYPLGLATTW
ncbi:hypothetical protein PRIPAC_77002 [Pristionchus pacificus]|uniref:G protein-coupled receptor n=1 Tax=Pristionchus pacificus TaxID=54126 RepID=A0A2A6C279_PRIPA|nr:hypothetical protein PRIPAC_77002 [Pristionchus pacificus]|eukprot:PDM72131.1 G protein-coupled receptor [Pristionchus pacificus]